MIKYYFEIYFIYVILKDANINSKTITVGMGGGTLGVGRTKTKISGIFQLEMVQKSASSLRKNADFGYFDIG